MARFHHLLLSLLLGAPGLAPAQPSSLSGNVFVQEDATLRIEGRTIHLFGIYVPATDETCYFFVRPIPCGPRASLALEFFIGARFAHCDIIRQRPDGTLEGLCRARGEDLSAWMVGNGWALALPYAPFEYHALERIARTRGLGIWAVPLGPRYGPTLPE